MVGTVTGSVFAQNSTLKELEGTADLILIGKSRATSIDGLVASVEITPVRVLKGGSSITSQSPTVAKVRVEQQYVDVLTKLLTNPTSQKNQSPLGMWFLKHLEGKDWDALPLSGSDSIPKYFVTISDLPLPDDFAYEPSATVQTKIIKELGAEMERVWGNNQPEYVRYKSLRFLALNSIATGMDGVAELAVRFSKSNSEQLRSFAMSWRIQGGDSKALTELEDEKTLLRSENRSSEIANAISSYRGSDPLFIQSLGKLTSKPIPARIREEAGRVLRAVHSKEAVPFLVAMLDSDLDNLKYDGVMGLASFAQDLPVTTPENVRTGNWLKPGPNSKSATYAVAPQEASQYMPATDTFEKNQTRYIGYWKTWWANHRSVLEQP